MHNEVRKSKAVHSNALWPANGNGPGEQAERYKTVWCAELNCHFVFAFAQRLCYAQEVDDSKSDSSIV